MWGTIPLPLGRDSVPSGARLRQVGHDSATARKVPHFPAESCPTSQRNAAPLQTESVPHFDRNPHLFQQAVEVFISDHINPGENWAQRLGVELEQSQFGVLCLTQENFQAPWLLFEAGAVAKKFGFTRVVPYLIDELPDTADRSPLAQFQRVRADYDGTYRLVQAINEVRESAQPTQRLERSFARWWPDLEQTLKGLPGPPQNQAGHRLDRQILEDILQKVTILVQAHINSSELPRPELTHLRNLRDQPVTKYRTSGTLKKELRHLRDLGYINNKQPIHTLPEEFELAQFFSLTDKGENYLKEYEAPV
jgi:hypothetical protein